MKKTNKISCIVLCIVLMVILVTPVFALQTASGSCAGATCTASLSRDTTSATGTTFCNGIPSGCTVSVTLDYYYTENNVGHRATTTKFAGAQQRATATATGTGQTVISISATSTHNVNYNGQGWYANLVD